ncbi:MBL fold metallo-hydrolase [Thiohalobacter sp. IOR34]|uniref:MBL fold metallo-hydrolase n=1 Tax=Thiohalobacter sp. IOR34 TaxID=3057176 RepID=UPI0025AF84B5|nr:MBL fold metallo-hydrolase [Thiohalobacter sp. IOR34]WJW75176.1 MBL fold metallo-hydrolase [Thiohalobacter sp. IOR34]
MKTTTLYDGRHRWIAFGRDPDKPEKIIDTNQYLIVDGKRALLMDPGGIEIFSAMLASVLRFTDIDAITDLFASHQDPDIISSLGLWDQALPHARLHAPWLWEGFLRHFGLNHIEYVAIPDEGSTLSLETAQIQFIPAHYLHASGNFHVYDPAARILMSGDVGAALEPEGAPMFVEDFEEHIPKMKMFHQRWMPSNKAKQDWIRRVRALDIDMLAPQHGRIFRGDDVKRFLDWFEALEVGTAVG